MALEIGLASLVYGVQEEEGLSRQEQEEEPCGYSSCALGGIHRALTTTDNCFNTTDSALYS